MTLQMAHAVSLDDSAVCSIQHLVDISGLSIAEIEDLIESGVIEPAGSAAPPLTFHLLHVVTVRQARRLRDDFELDRHGLSLAMTLLRRIDRLERALDAAYSRHPATAA